jgi:hypothetical protein
MSAQTDGEFDHRGSKNSRGTITLWNTPSLVRLNGVKGTGRPNEATANLAGSDEISWSEAQ